MFRVGDKLPWIWIQGGPILRAVVGGLPDFPTLGPVVAKNPNKCIPLCHYPR